MSKTYELLCYLCEKKFKTHRALQKHYNNRHTEETLDFKKVKFLDSDKDNSVEVGVPLLRLLDVASTEYKNGYLLWLAGVAEQINASLHPNFPGMFNDITMISLNF